MIGPESVEFTAYEVTDYTSDGVVDGGSVVPKVGEGVEFVSSGYVAMIEDWLTDALSLLEDAKEAGGMDAEWIEEADALLNECTGWDDDE